ncbi:hypothetical protein UlMin_009957 [Ulmus minor]
MNCFYRYNMEIRASKVVIWYATFGTNMWQPRFLCYIEGGQASYGSFDKTPSKEIIWKTFPHGLFLGPKFTQTWGLGGIAFLNPENNGKKKVHTCVYKITYVLFFFLNVLLEQFNDVLFQQNLQSTQITPPTSPPPSSIPVANATRAIHEGGIVAGRQTHLG